MVASWRLNCGIVLQLRGHPSCGTNQSFAAGCIRSKTKSNYSRRSLPLRRYTEAHPGPWRKQIKEARRRRMRTMLGARRRMMMAPLTREPEDQQPFEINDPEQLDLEPRTLWIQRVTYMVENIARGLKADDRVVLHRQRKWRFAGRTARLDDSQRSNRLLSWHPHGYRLPGRDQRYDGRMGFENSLAVTGQLWRRTRSYGQQLKATLRSRS